MGNDHQVGGTPRPAEDTLDRTGRQTPQQAAIVAQDGRGATDQQRNADWRKAGGEPGRAPVALGGSSQGESDQNEGPGAKVAGGLSRTERDAARRPLPEPDADEAERGKS